MHGKPHGSGSVHEEEDNAKPFPLSIIHISAAPQALLFCLPGIPSRSSNSVVLVSFLFPVELVLSIPSPYTPWKYTPNHPNHLGSRPSDTPPIHPYLTPSQTPHPLRNTSKGSPSVMAVVHHWSRLRSEGLALAPAPALTSGPSPDHRPSRTKPAGGVSGLS